MWEHKVFVSLYTVSLTEFLYVALRCLYAWNCNVLFFYVYFFFIWSKNIFADLQLWPWTTLSPLVVCHAESFPSAWKWFKDICQGIEELWGKCPSVHYHCLSLRCQCLFLFTGISKQFEVRCLWSSLGLSFCLLYERLNKVHTLKLSRTLGWNPYLLWYCNLCSLLPLLIAKDRWE